MKRKIILALVILSSLSFSANRKTRNSKIKKITEKIQKKITYSNYIGHKTGSPFPAIISRTSEQKQILDDYFKKRVELYKKSFSKNSLEAFAGLDKSIIEFACAKELNDVVRSGNELKKNFNKFIGKETKMEDEHYIIREVMNIFDK